MRRDSDDAAPLRAHLLQRVNLGALERAVRRTVDVFESSWQELVDSTVGLSGDNIISVKVGMTPAVAEWFETSRQAKPSRERFLARLAERYVETLDDPRQTAILAEEFGYKRSSIAATIRQARNKHKLLTPTTKGSPGGSLTPKARAILAERDQLTTEPEE